MGIEDIFKNVVIKSDKNGSLKEKVESDLKTYIFLHEGSQVMGSYEILIIEKDLEEAKKRYLKERQKDGGMYERGGLKLISISEKPINAGDVYTFLSLE